MPDPVPVLQQVVRGENVFRIIIRNTFKRRVLPVLRALIFAYSIGDLNITVIEFIVPENKVAFQLSYPADADGIIEAPCVNIHHIFQSRAIVYAVIRIGCKVKRNIGKIILFSPLRARLDFMSKRSH